MKRPARQLLIASIVAIHAALMLCGPCLHGLPGWGHRAELSRDFDGEHAKGASGNHLQADDCPVCHFFSQAQMPVDRASVVEYRCLIDLDPEVARTSVIASPLHLSSPRAPPGLASRVS